MTTEAIDKSRESLQKSFDLLIAKIGPIRIGSPKQFPFGWRKAAKGRTVWRIVEEIITQNLEKHHASLGLLGVEPSESEVSVYDMACYYQHESPLYINIKSAVVGGKRNKDDISKADGLIQFFTNPNQLFFVATFFIRFNNDMTITIEKAVVFPLAWISDIYVNPSNNGNLQSAYYKDLSYAVKRSNEEFLPLFYEAVNLANEKKSKKK